MRAKEGGKETTGEPSGRSCFQDGGKSNGGRICSFKNKFSAVHFANCEQIIAYPRRVYEEEAVFPPHVGLKHHNVYYRTLNRNTTSSGRDGTAFNLMKLPHAKVTAGQEN